jgi:hypothetical protein
VVAKQEQISLLISVAYSTTEENSCLNRQKNVVFLWDNVEERSCLNRQNIVLFHATMLI